MPGPGGSIIRLLEQEEKRREEDRAGSDDLMPNVLTPPGVSTPTGSVPFSALSGSEEGQLLFDQGLVQRTVREGTDEDLQLLSEQIARVSTRIASPDFLDSITPSLENQRGLARFKFRLRRAMTPGYEQEMTARAARLQTVALSQLSANLLNVEQELRLRGKDPAAEGFTSGYFNQLGQELAEQQGSQIFNARIASEADAILQQIGQHTEITPEIRASVLAKVSGVEIPNPAQELGRQMKEVELVGDVAHLLTPEIIENLPPELKGVVETARKQHEKDKQGKDFDPAGMMKDFRAITEFVFTEGVRGPQRFDRTTSFGTQEEVFRDVLDPVFTGTTEEKWKQVDALMSQSYPEYWPGTSAVTGAGEDGGVSGVVKENSQRIMERIRQRGAASNNADDAGAN